MFKLFINNLQVGNYHTFKEMVSDALLIYCSGKRVKRVSFTARKMDVKTFD